MPRWALRVVVQNANPEAEANSRPGHAGVDGAENNPEAERKRRGRPESLASNRKNA